MNLLYYRTGFASNSSSLHSTWHVDDPKKIEDDIHQMMFEWDMFVCASRAGIRKYIAAQLIMSMRRIPDIVVIAIIKYLYPEIKESEYCNHGSIDADVDHQSVWSLPRDLRGGGSNLFPSFEFVKDIEEYLVNSKTVIVGGNDNIDENEIPDMREFLKCSSPSKNELMREILNFALDDVVCVKDKDVWKMFDRTTGSKLRFSFNGNVEYSKSSSPELIDLIISNRCSHGCPYCYRKCTPESGVARMEDVYQALLYISSCLDVFEVAIGGGNIIEYPEFDKLCECISEIHRKKTIVCNTTLSWLDFKDENIEKIKNIFSVFKGIAVSISTPKQIENVIDFIIANKILFQRHNSAKISFQCIPELMTYEDIMAIIFSKELEKVSYSITFLGFKHTGRGSSPEYSTDEFKANKENFRKFLRAIPDLRKRDEFGEYSFMYNGMYPRTLGVDTQLIQNFPELKETQEQWCYTEHEGKFSCCVDLVSGYVLPSSFTEYRDKYKMKSYKIGKYVKYDIGNQLKKIYPKF